MLIMMYHDCLHWDDYIKPWKSIKCNKNFSNFVRFVSLLIFKSRSFSTKKNIIKNRSLIINCYVITRVRGSNMAEVVRIPLLTVLIDNVAVHRSDNHPNAWKIKKKISKHKHKHGKHPKLWNTTTVATKAQKSKFLLTFLHHPYPPGVRTLILNCNWNRIPILKKNLLFF